MNSPFDAHLNSEVVSAEEPESLSKKSVEKFSSPPGKPNIPSDGIEIHGKQAAEKFRVPDMEALWSPVQGEAARKLSTEKALKKMLVVDDLPVNRKLIGIQLQKLGYEIDQAENGQSAVEKIKAEKYALVFMDLDMPVMDGYQAAIEIRQHDLETGQHTPIVALSSYTRQVEKERCISSGMDDLISKGISGTKLKELISRQIRNKVIERSSNQIQAVAKESGVEIDLQLLLDTHGKIDEQIVDLSLGAMKTFIGCLSCALEDRDLPSVKHFARAIELPCSQLGLKSMTKLSLRIFADAAGNNWQTARQGMTLLESQYGQILDQLTGLSATLHRIDENSRD